MVVAVLWQGREVVYWRYTPSAALRVLHGHSNWVEVLAVSSPPAPEIPELFSAGMDKKVKKWELGTKFNPDAIYCNDEYVGHSATILCAAMCRSAWRARRISKSSALSSPMTWRQ